MHVLITTDTVGGVWTYTRELATGLVQRGIRVTLVSFGGIPPLSQTRWMEGFRDFDFHPTAFKLEWMQESQADLEKSAEYLLHLIRENKPHLLHFNQFAYGALECHLPRLVVAHSDVLSWWVSVHGQEPPPSSWLCWYRELVSRGLAGASAVVAPSRWMLDQIQRFQVRPAHSLVIHNGRTPNLFNPCASKDTTIVTVGRRWDAGKNTDLLLRTEMPAPVRIVGPKHPAVEEGCGHAEQDEVIRILAGTGIYAVTSRYEPFGLAPLEAALSGCAIVASDIPPLRELWEGAAVFFRDNDAVSLRAALEPLVLSPAYQRKWAGKSHQHALRNFTSSCMVDGYLSLYRALANAHQAVAA